MEIEKLLLANGANVDSVQVDGWTTAAHLARYNRRQDIEKLLAEMSRQ